MCLHSNVRLCAVEPSSSLSLFTSSFRTVAFATSATLDPCSANYFQRRTDHRQPHGKMVAYLTGRRVYGTGSKMFMLMCFCVIGLIQQVSAVNETEKTIAELYESGFQSYLEERWVDCIYNFETSMEMYRSFKQTTINCRLKCQEDAVNSPPTFPENIENLHFHENMIKKTLCLSKCKNLHFNNNLEVISKDTVEKFEELKAYQYLHLCYAKTKLFQQAASAAFTYLVVNPEAEILLRELRFYSALPEVDVDEIVNLEAQNYVPLYLNGSEAYHKEDYSSVIIYMEESLKEYLKAEEDCRTYCEEAFDQGWFPDLTSSISDHFTFCLKCKRNCTDKLNTLNGERHKDLLASHYHYLLLAYYKVGDLKKASEAVASYLLFFPSDKTMLNNKDIYSKMTEVVLELFTPREEAVTYVKRQVYESTLLHYIEKEFAFLEDSKNEGDTPALEENKRPKKQKTRDVLRIKNASKKKIKVIMDGKELQGRFRVLADGFAEKAECQNMIKVAKLASKPYDGSRRMQSPHTHLELIERVSFARVALLIYRGLLEPEVLELLLDISETARHYVQHYFKLKKQLYFETSLLTCRTIKNDSQNGAEFSHRVHADGCTLEYNGTCTKNPLYTSRHYSAILYLNDDFEGGELVFASDIIPTRIQSTVKPKCGRLISFSSGGENPHGVYGIRRGERFVLAMWYTLDPTKSEVVRQLAYKTLAQLKENGTISEKLLNRLKSLA